MCVYVCIFLFVHACMLSDCSVRMPLCIFCDWYVRTYEWQLSDELGCIMFLYLDIVFC